MSLELGLLGEILTLARDPEVNLEDFGDRVSRSPKLAREVVRISNSALYGMEGKITRLERAVLILGIKTVAEVSSTLLVSEAVKRANIGGLKGDALWMHSLETGLCAQLLARCTGLPLDAEAYLCGLIHDLGIIALWEEHGEAYEDAVRCTLEEDVPLEDLEESIFGETHGQRLARLAEEWDFPELLREGVAYHHAPEGAPSVGRSLAQLIRLAHVVVDRPTAGWRDHVPCETDDALLEALGLDAEDVEDVRQELAERLKDVTLALG